MSSRTPTAIGVLALLLAASAALTAPLASAAPADVRGDVLRLTNAERAKAGCPALQPDAALNRAAGGHAQDMAGNNFVGHNGSNGSTAAARVRAQGYQWRAVAENVAGGRASASEVVRGWMASSGHRANILNCRLRDLGVGYAQNSNTGLKHFWVQVFGTR